MFIKKCPAVQRVIAYGEKKSFNLLWRCHQLLPGFVASDHLPRVSRQSANEKDDNEIMCGDLLTFTLQLRKTLTRRPSMKTVQSIIAPNGPLPPNDQERRKGRVLKCCVNEFYYFKYLGCLLENMIWYCCSILCKISPNIFT